jgi:hypothetical protein
MTVRGNEILEPEELSQLGAVFDETWAALSGGAGTELAHRRTTLALILLRLAGLKRLGPDELKATAIRWFRSEVTGSEPADHHHGASDHHATA